MSKFVKDLITKELRSRYSQTDNAIWVEMIGIDGITTNQFRRELREKKLRLEVVRNALLRRAVGDGHGEIHPALLDLVDQLVAAGLDGAGLLGGLGIRVAAEGDYLLGRADAFRQADRSADGLLSLARIDSQVGDQVDRLVELGLAESFEGFDCIFERNRLGGPLLLVLSVTLAAKLRHR